MEGERRDWPGLFVVVAKMAVRKLVRLNSRPARPPVVRATFKVLPSVRPILDEDSGPR